MKISRFVYLYPSKIIGGLGGCNTYVIQGTKKQVIIDMGRGQSLKRLKKAARKDNLDILKIDEIWITHIHPDHAKVASLAEKLNLSIRCHPGGASVLSASLPWESLIEKQKSLAGQWRKVIYRGPDVVNRFIFVAAYGRWRRVRKKIIQPFQIGETIDFGNFKVKILSLAGHTEDSLGFWIAKERILISGDILRTNKEISFPCWNTFQADFSRTLKTLLSLKWTRINILAPGHEPLLKGFLNVYKLIRLNIKTCQVLEKRIKKFLMEERKVELHKLVEMLENFWPEGLTTRDRLHSVLAIVQALEKKNRAQKPY